MLTVEEMSVVLHIGRASAYEHVRRFRATGGKHGIPVIEIGRSLRVPTAALLKWMGEAVGNDVLPTPPPTQQFQDAAAALKRKRLSKSMRELLALYEEDME